MDRLNRWAENYIHLFAFLLRFTNLHQVGDEVHVQTGSGFAFVPAVPLRKNEFFSAAIHAKHVIGQFCSLIQTPSTNNPD